MLDHSCISKDLESYVHYINDAILQNFQACNVYVVLGEYRSKMLQQAKTQLTTEDYGTLNSITETYMKKLHTELSCLPHENLNLNELEKKKLYICDCGYKSTNGQSYFAEQNLEYTFGPVDIYDDDDECATIKLKREAIGHMVALRKLKDSVFFKVSEPAIEFHQRNYASNKRTFECANEYRKSKRSKIHSKVEINIKHENEDIYAKNNLFPFDTREYCKFLPKDGIKGADEFSEICTEKCRFFFRIGKLNHKAKFDKHFWNYNFEGDESIRFEVCSENEINFILGPPGTGKTRFLTKLLYEKLGYFFTFAGNGDFGSQDLKLCMKFMKMYPNDAHFCLNLLYYVRALVCKELINLKYSTPREILLAQLHPKRFFQYDIFAALYANIFTQHRWSVIPQIEYFDIVCFDDAQVSTPEDENGKIDCVGFSNFVSKACDLFKWSLFFISGNFIHLKTVLLKRVQLDGFTKNYNYFTLYLEQEHIDYKNYCEKILSDRDFSQSEIQTFLEKIKKTRLCKGRPSYVNFFLENLLKGQSFDKILLRFYKSRIVPGSRDFLLNKMYSDMKAGHPDLKIGTTFFESVCTSMAHFCLSLNTDFEISGQYDRLIKYHLEFVHFSDTHIIFSISELVMFKCLRNIIPILDVAIKIHSRLHICQKKKGRKFAVEYLGAFGIANKYFNGDRLLLKNLQSFAGSFKNYLIHGKENEILFPDNLCGPNIVYKYGNVLEIIRIENFGHDDNMGYHTSDPALFYCCEKSGEVFNCMKGRKKTLDELLKNYSIQRSFFGISTDETIGDETLISKANFPEFFGYLGMETWDLLKNYLL